MIMNVFAALSIIICAIASTTCAEGKIYVFYPTTARPQAVQERLQNALGDLTVTVFGRQGDFQEKMNSDPPDAIITKPALIDGYFDYSVALSGVRKGTPNEKYVLVSIGKPLEPLQVNGETVIGAIDLFGRNGMRSFVSQFFPVEPKIRRVTKIEDLLPLLSFDMADGVIVEEVFMDYFRATSHMDFTVTPLAALKSGIVALCIRKNGKVGNTIEVLKGSDRSIGSLFEVDLWK